MRPLDARDKPWDDNRGATLGFATAQLQHYPLTPNQRERISCCSVNRLQSKKSVLMIPSERILLYSVIHFG
jgi:hypothetical protein